MKKLNTGSKGLGLIAFVFCLATFQPVQAESTANNRNDVYDALSNIEAGLVVPGLDIWINGKTEDPIVNIGDPLSFTMTSDTSAFYTLIYVDSKGSTSILKPMNSYANNGVGLTHLVYPPQDSQTVAFTQAEPIGQDAIYLLASERNIPTELLGLGANEDYRDLGKDMGAIHNLVAQINSQSGNNPLSVRKYTYAVESEKTQYSTRSIRRKVVELEKVDSKSMNFNNINFEFNVAQLTSPGKLELDGLGNALVTLEGESGGFPLVKLIGHTDSIASETYNIELSAKRAESAKQYLVSEYGVPSEKILTVGAGEAVPIGSNSSDTGRALNRRVELKVIAQ